VITMTPLQAQRPAAGPILSRHRRRTGRWLPIRTGPANRSSSGWKGSMALAAATTWWHRWTSGRAVDFWSQALRYGFRERGASECWTVLRRLGPGPLPARPDVPAGGSAETGSTHRPAEGSLPGERLL